MASYMDNMKYRQDMPPKGGYSTIYYMRTFPRVISHAGKIAAAMVALTLYGAVKHHANKSYARRVFVEQNDTRLVTDMFLTAERDRQWLKLLKRNLEEEREIMKDVPGWRVGTFYGEPVYYTLPNEMWWDPYFKEINAHYDKEDIEYVKTWRLEAESVGGPKWYDKYLPERWRAY